MTRTTDETGVATPTDEPSGSTPTAGAPEFVLPRWFWVAAFVVGVVFLTGIRPFLRRIPEPPPVLGALSWPEMPAKVDVWGREVPDAASSAVWLVAFDAEEGTSDAHRARARVLRKLAMVHRAQRPGTLRLMTIGTGDAKQVRRTAVDEDVAIAEWFHVTFDEGNWARATEEVRTAWTDALARENAPSVGWRDAIVLVDGMGRVRGFYDPAFVSVVSEVYHRGGHVVESAASSGGAGWR